MLVFYLFLSVVYLKFASASVGDNSPFFQKCLDKCVLLNCTEDQKAFVEGYSQPVAQQILQWSCLDECDYDCMWKTVEIFEKRKYKIPQFHGKWPFKRFLGIQEPASAIFSLFNFIINWKLLRRFRKQVRSDSPYYWLWHAFSTVCLNAWCWSTIFHTRDLPFTETMDYCCAFSMVIMMGYCMTMRVFRGIPKFYLVFLSVIYFIIFSNHVAYLSMGNRIDYTYNMQLNLIIGITTAMVWLGWCVWNRLRLHYVWKCGLFLTLAGVFLMLEIADIPPIFWVFDCHSLWHLSSVPTTILFYSFIIDDCKYLREQKFFHLEQGEPFGTKRKHLKHI